jgi:hypothetical protein
MDWDCSFSKELKYWWFSSLIIIITNYAYSQNIKNELESWSIDEWIITLIIIELLYF